MDVPQEILDEVSKLKKPNKYKLYAAGRATITVLCCIALLGLVGFLVYLAVDAGWFDDSSGFLFVVGFIAVAAVVSAIIKIWELLYFEKISEWKRRNYPKTHSDYHKEIQAISDLYYDKWESFIKSEECVPSWLREWGKAFVVLEYNRVSPEKTKTKKVEIPFFYQDNYYQKEDYKDVLSGIGMPNGEQLVKEVINPSPVSDQYLTTDLAIKTITAKSIFSKIFILSKGLKEISTDNRLRYYLNSNNGLQNVILLDKYSSTKDVADFCTPGFIQNLIPSKRLTIIAVHKEYSKEEFESECIRRKNAVLFEERIPIIQKELANWGHLIGYPYYYFYNYYPKSVPDINFKDSQIKETIFKFKDSSPANRMVFGKFIRSEYRNAYDRIVNLVSSKICSTIGGSALSQVSFVCIPSSSAAKTKDRLEEFYEMVCSRTGMDNAFQYVHGEGENVKHLGGTGLSQIQLNKRYFSGRKVVIFDDIVTSGNTMRKMVNALKECGAEILFIISIARTHHHIFSHPIESDPIFQHKY